MIKLLEFDFNHRIETPNARKNVFWRSVSAKNRRIRRKILLIWFSIPPEKKLFIIERPFYHVKIIRFSPRKMDYDNFVPETKHIRDVVSDLINPGHAPGQADNEKYMKFEYEQMKGVEHTIRIEVWKSD